jgi:hypothetical protein
MIGWMAARSRGTTGKSWNVGADTLTAESRLIDRAERQICGIFAFVNHGNNSRDSIRVHECYDADRTI